MVDKTRYFKISDFMSNIRTKGILKTNRYEVSLVLPPRSPLENIIKNLTGLNDYNKLLSLRCDSVQLPGMSFATVDGFLRYGYGTPEAVPYSAIMDSLTASFIIDTNSRIHMFFYHWVNYIANFRARGQKNITDSWGLMGASTYELSYRDDYAATMEIKVYDDVSDTCTIQAIAYNVYPKSLPQTDLAYGSEGELVKLSIPFIYTDYEIQYNYQKSREGSESSDLRNR